MRERTRFGRDWELARGLWWDGLPSHQIAARLGCSASTVREHARLADWPMRRPRGGSLVRTAAPRHLVVRCAHCAARYAVPGVPALARAVCTACGSPRAGAVRPPHPGGPRVA